VTFNLDLLRAYPHAPAACQDVVVQNGTRMIHFRARVSTVSKDKVKLQFLNARGEPIANSKELEFTAAPGSNISVNGKRVTVGELQRGDKLDFWVPEGRAGLVTDPNATALSTITLN
jgi:hypothetical protein